MSYRKTPVIVLLVVALLAVTPSSAHADDLTRRNKMRRLLNVVRMNHGLPTFRLNAELSHFAWKHSRRMAELGRLYHTVDLYSRVRAYSPSTWGENVGYAGTLRRVRTLWMHSDGHRHNILKRGFRRIGIGVFVARGRVWVTAIFYGG
jgi:uncharacterized protein YkwD